MRPHSPKRQQSTRDLRETRKVLAIRCDGRCEHCGYALPVADDGTPVFSIHHRLSRAQGGGDGPENTLAVYPPHHNVQPGSIHQEPAWSMENGWIVPRGQDPARTPVMIAGQLSWLTPDGAARPVEGCPDCGRADCGPERCAFVGAE